MWLFLESNHLKAFTLIPLIAIPSGCIKEINRLRKLHRTDLPQIDVPVVVKRGNRMVTGSSDFDNKEAKKNTVSNLSNILHVLNVATQVQLRATVPL